MPPADKSASKTFPDKLAEASVTVLDLTMESFRMMIKGDRVLTRVRGSVLPTIAGPIVLFALYASFFAAIRSTGEQTGSDGDELTVLSATDPHWSRQGILPSLGSSVISLMSMAIGLLVSFRTSSAYDRWWACRGLWATISATSRNMMMNLSLRLREDGNDDQPNEDKVTAMKLIIAYSVALKHYCREKPGLHHPDLAPYLPQGFVQSFDGRTPKIPPLEIIKLFHQYVTMFEREGKLDSRTAGSLLSGANIFTDQLSNAERILTPWPLAYSIHLKQIITLYCLALPPQLASALGWWVVPVTSAAVFTFFGMEAIALEISNPCGYDLNDLWDRKYSPIDHYCTQLKTELADMMEPPYRPTFTGN